MIAASEVKQTEEILLNKDLNKQTLSYTLKRLLNRFLCPHNYHLINQFTIDSQFDIVISQGKTPTTWDSTRRVIVSDYKCSYCDKTKRLKVKTL
jgi:hypothetical protein